MGSSKQIKVKGNNAKNRKVIASLLVASTYAVELSLADDHDHDHARCVERAQRKFDRLNVLVVDDVVDLEEFLAPMIAKKTNKFNNADTDGNGTLNFDEWKSTKRGKKRMGRRQGDADADVDRESRL